MEEKQVNPLEAELNERELSPLPAPSNLNWYLASAACLAIAGFLLLLPV